MVCSKVNIKNFKSRLFHGTVQFFRHQATWFHSKFLANSDPHRWSVHASQENLLPGGKASFPRRMMFRVFAVLRQISQPAYYYYGLGDEVQLSVEIMPVKSA